MSLPKLAVFALAFVAILAAALPAAADVTVNGAWVRGTVTGQKVTGAFMQLTSPTATALVNVTTPVARTAEVHEMKNEGGVMRMKAIDRLALPAATAVDLKPGGYHVMLFDLKQPLSEGDVVPMTLTFEDSAGRRSTLEVKASVKALTAGTPGAKQ
jgi:periplasmic copper chaperone A